MISLAPGGTDARTAWRSLSKVSRAALGTRATYCSTVSLLLADFFLGTGRFFEAGRDDFFFIPRCYRAHQVIVYPAQTQHFLAMHLKGNTDRIVLEGHHNFQRACIRERLKRVIPSGDNGGNRQHALVA